MRREGWEVSRMRGGAAASSWMIVLDLESRSLVWDGLLVLVLRANDLRVSSMSGAVLSLRTGWCEARIDEQ